MELNHLASEYTNAERRPQSISLREYRLLYPYSTAEKSPGTPSFVPVLMRKKAPMRTSSTKSEAQLSAEPKKRGVVVAPRALSRNVRSISNDGRNEGSAVSPQCFQFPAQLRRGSFPASSRRRSSLGASFKLPLYMHQVQSRS